MEELLILLEQAAGLCQDMNDGYLAPWQPLKQAEIGLDTKSTFELGLGYKARCKLLQDPKRAGYLAPWQPGIGLDTKKSTFELEPGYSWALDFELVYSW